MSEKNINKVLTDALSGLDEDVINEVSEQRYRSIQKGHTKKKRTALLLAAAISCFIIAGTMALVMAKKDDGNTNEDPPVSGASFITETEITEKTVVYSAENTICVKNSGLLNSSCVVEKDNICGNLIFNNYAEMETVNDEKYSDALFYAVIDCSGSYLWKFYEAAGYIEKYGYDECVKLEQSTMLSYFQELGVTIDEYGDHLYIGKFSYGAIKAIEASKQFPEDMIITLLPKGYTLKDLSE